MPFRHEYTARAHAAKLGRNSHAFSTGRRKLKIQIRTSPMGKAKAINKPTKKRGTGVAAAYPDYPASTNVSSPIQAASRHRAKQKYKESIACDLHRNQYTEEDFVVNDDDLADSEDESDDFEPVRKKGASRSSNKRRLGPPITVDEKMESLNEIHQIIVENFLDRAKQQSQKARQRDTTQIRYD